MDQSIFQEKHFPLTIIIPMGNRKDVLEDCIKSSLWADEVIIVDSYTTDGSYQIAKKYPVRIIQREYDFSAKQKNWAIPQAKNEWVFILDTDERITIQLKNEIIDVISLSTENVGFRVPRLNYFLGKPLLHAGYFPDYQIRLFKREFGLYDLRKVHAHVLLNGPKGTLNSPIIHYAHQSIDQTIRNLLILMTTWESEQRKETKKIGLWLQITFRPVAAFLLRYVRQGGWRDGYRGLVISLIWAMYVSMTYMKIWEKDLNLPDSWWNEDWQRVFSREE